MSLGSQGKYSEADEGYLRAVGIQEKALGPDHPDLVITLRNRAYVLELQVEHVVFRDVWTSHIDFSHKNVRILSE